MGAASPKVATTPKAVAIPRAATTPSGVYPLAHTPQIEQGSNQPRIVRGSTELLAVDHISIPEWPFADPNSAPERAMIEPGMTVVARNDWGFREMPRATHTHTHMFQPSSERFLFNSYPNWRRPAKCC